MAKTYCPDCNVTHTPLMCFNKPRSRLKIEAAKSSEKRAVSRQEFFLFNHPDEEGMYTCYLQISLNCPKKLTINQVTQEHVLPKGTWPEVKYSVINLKVACEACNKIKGHRTVYDLAKEYAQIFYMINTPAWKEWERDISLRLKRPLPI